MDSSTTSGSAPPKYARPSVFTSDPMWSRPMLSADAYSARPRRDACADASSIVAEAWPTLMSTRAPSEPTMTPASASRVMSILPSVPTATKIWSSVASPVTCASVNASAPTTATLTNPTTVPTRAAALLRLNPWTTNTDTATMPIAPASVASSGSCPARSAGTIASRTWSRWNGCRMPLPCGTRSPVWMTRTTCPSITAPLSALLGSPHAAMTSAAMATVMTRTARAYRPRLPDNETRVRTFARRGGRGGRPRRGLRRRGSGGLTAATATRWDVSRRGHRRGPREPHRPGRALFPAQPERGDKAEDVGSETSVALVASGDADFGFISRDIKAEEKGKVVAIPYAGTGTGLAVNAANPVSALSKEQVRRIYSGEITDWSQVGGQPGEIRALRREQGSATRASFEAYFFEGKPTYGKNVLEVVESTATYQAVRDFKGAITMITIQKTTAEDRTMRLLAIDSVAATTRNVNSGAYPVRRPIVLLLHPDTSKVKPAVLAFFEFIKSPEGQDILAGF